MFWYSLTIGPYQQHRPPDSDASTVAARTEDAKAMAKQKLKETQEAQEDQNSEGGIKRKNADESLGESSTRPKLPRGSQSFELLKTQVGEPASGSGDRDGANTGMTAVKAKAQPPKPKETTPASEVPALKEELAATPKTTQTAKAVQECLNRASTQELCESAKAGTAAPAVQPPPSTPTPCASPTSAAPTLATPPSATPTPSSAKAPAASPPEVKESKEPEKVDGAGKAKTGTKPADESSDSEDSQELLQKEELAKAKRAAHARYMRFSRSLSSTLVIDDLPQRSLKVG